MKVKQPTIFGISLAFRYKDRIILVWARRDGDISLYLNTESLLKSNVTKSWHNARYDLRVCKENRIKVGGQQHCTLTMARIYWDRRKKHSLQALSEFLYPELSDWEVKVKKEFTKLQTRYTRAGHEPGYTNYSFLPDELVGPYSMTDSFIGLMLCEKLLPIMEKTFPELYERELKVMYIVSKIEERGLAWDIKKAKRETRRLTKPMNDAEEVLQVFTGPDKKVNYWKNVRDTLFGLGVTAKQLTEKGRVTTEADTLNKILKTTKKKKVKEYLEKLPLTKRAKINNGIVYTSINPADTRTGRMASRNPNLQNVPTLNPRRGRTSGGTNPVRSCFLCREGFTNYYFDYSQMEIALFGLYTNERLILDTYANGNDIHGVMAETLYGSKYTEQERDRTKDTNYGIIYGMGVQGMAKYRAVSLSEAKDFLRFYHQQFPSVSSFLDECKFQLRNQGYVEDWFGKRYHVPLNQAYKAVNCLVQGGCAQIFKIALLNLEERGFVQSTNINVILPAHDEFQVEKKRYGYPERQFCQDFIRCMVEIDRVLDRGLTLRVDASKSTTNWAEKKKIEI